MLEQEQHAELPKTESAPAAPPKPKEERLGVSPLQTYRGDVERVVHEGQGVSVVSIAAAEAERRGKAPLQTETPEEKSARKDSWIMIAGGASLVLLASAALAFVLLRPTTMPVAEAPQAPFISVDNTALVPVPAGQPSRDVLMTNLLAARARTKLPVGLIEWLYVAEPDAAGGSAVRQLGIAELLETAAPQAPPEILRVLDGTYLIGVHSFDENQPFLLLRVDSYETAYAGMLAWERTLKNDLAPFFNRNPSPKQSGAQAPASSTPQFLQTGFADKVVENRDTRAVQNDAGDIVLLWTFLGRDTVLITTNEYTLREVLSRLTTTPVVPIPGK